jgi:hypothetical protein
MAIENRSERAPEGRRPLRDVVEKCWPTPSQNYPMFANPRHPRYRLLTYQGKDWLGCMVRLRSVECFRFLPEVRRVRRRQRGSDCVRVIRRCVAGRRCSGTGEAQGAVRSRRLRPMRETHSRGVGGATASGRALEPVPVRHLAVRAGAASLVDGRGNRQPCLQAVA